MVYEGWMNMVNVGFWWINGLIREEKWQQSVDFPLCWEWIILDLFGVLIVEFAI